MSMTDPALIARLAEGLTKAERTAVIRSGGSRIVTRRLFERGWYRKVCYDGRARYGFLEQPTDQTIALLAHLTAAQEKK